MFYSMEYVLIYLCSSLNKCSQVIPEVACTEKEGRDTLNKINMSETDHKQGVNTPVA